MITEYGIGIAGLGSYLPGAQIPATFFFTEEELASPAASHPLFKAPSTRHHVSRDERASEMIVAAARPILERAGLAAHELDVLITNVMLPDHPITGSGAETAALLGASPSRIVDLHNGGCASFGYMLMLASDLIRSGAGRTALVCNVQNGAGQVFAQPGMRSSPYSAVAGDGCGVALLTDAAPPRLIGATVAHAPQYARDLELSGGSRKYWEAGTEDLMVSFDSDKLGEIIDRGNRLVPEAVGKLCADLGVATSAIDVLITNQPNKLFLRNWREALGLDEDRHVDTFDELGNLYTAGVPITLDRAVRDGRIRDGDLVVLSGFAHAGDMASAVAIRWAS